VGALLGDAFLCLLRRFFPADAQMPVDPMRLNAVLDASLNTIAVQPVS
jgi:hypothetical protein